MKFVPNRNALNTTRSMMPSIAKPETRFSAVCLLVGFLSLAFSSCSHDLSNGHSYSKLYPIQQDDAWGWIDSVGNVVVAPEPNYCEASFFIDGLGYLIVGDCKEVVFYNGRLERIFENDDAWAPRVYSGGFGSLVTNGDKGAGNELIFFNRLGQQLFKIENPYGGLTVEDGMIISPMGDPPMRDLNGNRMGPDGVELSRCETGWFGWMDPAWYSMYMREGLLKVMFLDRFDSMEGPEFTFLDKQGALKPYSFHNCGCFNHGLAFAKDTITKLYGYIDHDGRWAIAPQYLSAKNFSEGLAPVEMRTPDDHRSWGYIDSSGKGVIDFQFDDAMPFYSGRALTLKGWDGANYIDRSGKPIIPVNSDYWHIQGGTQFHDGLGITCVQSFQDRIVETSGKFISPVVTYNDRYHLWWDENLIRISDGWMNHEGKWVWQPKRLP